MSESATGGVRHVMLIGPMGVGKTSIGAALAEELAWTFLDSDRIIEELEGSTGAEIAANLGVDRLHAVELDTLERMAGSEVASVIAPAASVVDSTKGREVLADHIVVTLFAIEPVLSERRSTGRHRRSVEDPSGRELEQRRQPFWEELGDLSVDTCQASPAALAKELAAEIRRLPSW